MSSPRDTISSANSYYNNQYRVDPGFVRGCREIEKRQVKDTLETKQQRLERQLETRFNLNQQVPSGKIVLFVQVGKYAILAFVMPPFYLFYEGPRWVLITIQPLFLVVFEKAGAILLLISTFAMDFWAGVGKRLQFFKKPKDILKNKFKTLAQVLLKRIVVLGRKIDQVFQPITRTLQKMQHYLVKVQEKRASFILSLKIFPRLMQKKFKEKKDIYKQTLKEKTAALLVALKQVQIPFIALQKVLNPVAIFAKNQFVNVVNPILKVTSTCLSTSKAIVNKLINQSKDLGNMLSVPFNHVVKAVEIPLKNAIKHAERIVSTLRKKVSIQAEALVNMVQTVTVAAITPMQKTFVQIGEFSKGTGLNLIQKGKLIFERLKRMQPIVKRVIEALRDGGKKGFTKFKQISDSSMRSIKKVLVFCFEKCEKLPAGLSAFWKKLKKWLARLSKRIVWVLRLTLAWTKIILRYSLSHLWD